MLSWINHKTNQAKFLEPKRKKGPDKALNDKNGTYIDKNEETGLKKINNEPKMRN